MKFVVLHDFGLDFLASAKSLGQSQNQNIARPKPKKYGIEVKAEIKD